MGGRSPREFLTQKVRSSVLISPQPKVPAEAANFSRNFTMRFVVIGILLALLAGTIYVSHYGWVSAGDVTMPAWGWLMMGLGIFFTVVVGGGLMILIFYSSRAGYDEPPAHRIR